MAKDGQGENMDQKNPQQGQDREQQSEKSPMDNTGQNEKGMNRNDRGSVPNRGDDQRPNPTNPSHDRDDDDETEGQQNGPA